MIIFGFFVAFSTHTLAREVIVKYRTDPVNVDGFVEYQLQPSSFVKELIYDADNAYLIVRLKHIFYHYCGVPQKTVSRWVSAESLGKFYHSNIRGRFNCRTGYVPQYR